jgi:transposase-like protein
VATEGGAGLIRAAEESFPRAVRQRRLAHRMRNLQAKMPEAAWPQRKAGALACYPAPPPDVARVLGDDFVSRYEPEPPTAADEGRGERIPRRHTSASAGCGDDAIRRGDPNPLS